MLVENFLLGKVVDFDQMLFQHHSVEAVNR
jgi:hypothetical protein